MYSHNNWTFVLIAGFFQHNIFKIHPSCSIYQYFIPFYSQIIVLERIYISQFCLSICPLRDISVLSIFWLLWIMLLWISMNMFLYRHIFLCLLGVYLGVKFLGPTNCWSLLIDSSSWWWTGRPGMLQFMGPLSTTVCLVKAMVFQWSCMDVRVGL